MKLTFGRWLGAFGLCAVVVVFCVYFVDRPVALAVNAHLSLKKDLGLPLDIVLLFVPLGGLAIVAAGCTVLAGRVLPYWLEAAMLAGFAATAAITCNYFLLQPGFGRIDIVTWLAHPEKYGFVPLHGRSGGGLPSGHTTLAASYLGVFAISYPRARIFAAVAIGAVMLGLVLAGWHFVSDVIAGLFWGATVATMTVTLFRARDAQGALSANASASNSYDLSREA